MGIREELKESHDHLLSLDIQDIPDDSKTQYLDTLHRLSMDLTTFEIVQLKSANDLIRQESEKINAAAERLVEVALNDKNFEITINVISDSLQVLENLVTITF
ncbi:hypothetical protein [Leucothrix arctica]|uniref:Uncharacterized protein n=1 Tax=Leucothrix arctica TaxID=1481894 RepID=A0A317C9B9_9GAMM|nr:hypothetical protein [Leucothrix arctica]PWQ95204.1 hypothetical protein DKT75_12715 [Leucothrix arctica]